MPEANTEHAFRVEDALRHAYMSKTQVVAGSAGLRNLIVGVGVLDISDLDAVRAGQLVLSNAYPLVDQNVRGLIDIIADKGASAFGIKLSDYWTEVPESLKERAEHRSLPLLILPEGPFDEIVNPLLMEIAQSQARTLQKLSALHNALTEAALREEGDPLAIVEILREALGQDAAILDESGRLVAGTGFLDRQLPDLWHAARKAMRDDYQTVTFEGRSILVVPVPVLQAKVGALLLGETHSDDSFAIRAGERAAVVIGMLLAGRRKIREVHRRFERELLEDIASNRASRQDARERAAWIGWEVGEQYMVLVLGRPANARLSGEIVGMHPITEETFKAFDEEIATTDLRVRVFLKYPGIGLIVHQGREDPLSIVRQVVSNVATVARHFRDFPPAIGVSAPRDDIADLPDALEEAALALLLSPCQQSRDLSVQWFANLGPTRLFHRVANKRRLFDSASTLLSPLPLEGEYRGAGELLETLSSLLAHNMNLKAVANEQFFHYNTIRYRVHRLRQLLGDRLDTPSDRLALSMSLAALRYLSVQEDLSSTRPNKSFGGDPSNGRRQAFKTPDHAR